MGAKFRSASRGKLLAENPSRCRRARCRPAYLRSVGEEDKASGLVARAVQKTGEQAGGRTPCQITRAAPARHACVACPFLWSTAGVVTRASSSQTDGGAFGARLLCAVIAVVMIEQYRGGAVHGCSRWVAGNCLQPGWAARLNCFMVDVSIPTARTRCSCRGVPSSRRSRAGWTGRARGGPTGLRSSSPQRHRRMFHDSCARGMERAACRAVCPSPPRRTPSRLVCAGGWTWCPHCS